MINKILQYFNQYGFKALVNRGGEEIRSIIQNKIIKPVSGPASDKYPYPWILDYSHRLEELGRGKTRIAYYYGKHPDSSSYRYRVYNMVKVWQGTGDDISAGYFHLGDIGNLNEIVSAADIIVICRAAYCDKINNAISSARSMRKKVIYDIDDLVFDTKYVQMVLETLGTNLELADTWTNWFGDFSRHGAVLQMCESVTTSNDFLAEKIREYTPAQVSVIPNFLNEEQLLLSKELYVHKRSATMSRDNIIYLGYFSGTRTHNNDFRILTDALIDIFEKNRNVRLKIVGLLDLDEKLQKYRSRIDVYPFQNYLDLQKHIGTVHINLIPLQINDFTNSKSELKYFEAGIVGTVSIASPTFVYKRVISDGINGLLAGNDQWQQKIQILLDDYIQYREIAHIAYIDAEQHYSWDKMGGLLKDTFLRD